MKLESRCRHSKCEFGHLGGTASDKVHSSACSLRARLTKARLGWVGRPPAPLFARSTNQPCPGPQPQDTWPRPWEPGGGSRLVTTRLARRGCGDELVVGLEGSASKDPKPPNSLSPSLVFLVRSWKIMECPWMTISTLC